MRKALVHNPSGLVVNVIVADDAWQPPSEHSVIDAEGVPVSPGDTWDGQGFKSPQPTPEQLAAEVKATKRRDAEASAEEAIKANRDTPWGRVLHDLAVAQGWIDPD